MRSRRPALTVSVQRATRALGAPLRAQIMRALRAAQQRPAELSVRLVSHEEGLQLNQQFRHQNHATNVLSFVYDSTPIVRGDLVLCVPVIEREAFEQGKPLLAHYMHLIVHGMLHLHGYDHEQDVDAKQMEMLEIEMLHRLGFANPYVEMECD